MDAEKFDPGLYAELVRFYEFIQSRKGAVVRGSVPAPVLYRLRRELGQSAKVVPLNPFLSISIYKDFAVILLREGSQGIYHYSQMSRQDGEVRMQMIWSMERLRFFAATAFQVAEANQGVAVASILKESVLGELGRMWLEAFHEESRRHPAIRFSHRPSGAGFSDMWISAREFGVVATDDQSGDILSDLVPTVLYNGSI